MKNIILKNSWTLALLLCSVVLFNSCKDKDDWGENFKKNSSAPLITNIYLEDANSSVPDRKVDFARLGQTIRLEGENFLGVDKVVINGYEITFSPTLMSNNSMIVQISSKVPTVDAADDVRDKIVLEKKGVDPYTYTFEIRAAAPTITNISHSMAKAGDRITLTGTGLQEITTVTFPGNKVVNTGIVSDDENGLSFSVTVPEGVSDEGGAILAVGANGGAYSPACFNYKKGLLHNFDDVRNFSWGQGAGLTEDTILLTDLIPTSGNGPKSQGGYKEFNSGGNLAAGTSQRFWLNSANAAITAALNTIPASTSADECGIQMDIYVVGEWNSGFIRFAVVDGYGDGRYCMVYQPVYVDKVYTPSAFVNPNCWFTITLPFGSGPDFAGQMYGDIVSAIGQAPYLQIGPWLDNTKLRYTINQVDENIFNPVPATEKVYFDNIRVVPLTTPPYSDFPDE
ncbi:MAG: glycan-binding surface protein [Candidatus Azobacteroides sp.]|nr:glycan-binding surface protein [Candidatus Azobacteroides sp.]